MRKNLLFFLSIFAATAAYSQPTDNVVVYYPFNGNANDVSGNNKNGTVSNATLTADRLGNANTAYFFNGSNSLIYMPTNLAFNNQAYCISVWVKPMGNHRTTETWQVFVDLRGQYQTSINYYQANDATRPGSSSFHAYSSPTVANIYSPANSIPLNTWTHIVGNYGNNTLELYVNGVLQSSSTIAPPSAVCCYNNTIGKDYYLYQDRGWVYGSIDEVLIYGRKLTATEIQALYNRQLTTGYIAELVKGSPIEYAYDANGNRYSRRVVTLKSAPITPANSDSARFALNPFEDPTEDFFGKDKVLIYPNPTKGQLKVDVQAAATNNAVISLYNLTGRQLIQIAPAQQSNILDLSGYPIGPYIMRIQIGSKTKEWKIVKE